MWLYPLTAFLGAFLLFVLEPMIAKFHLPWFGGGASVWTVSLVFFTCFLFVGYLYAHGLSRLAHRTQTVVHLALLLTSLVLLALTSKISGTPGLVFFSLPSLEQTPTLLLLTQLLLGVAVPYTLLAATSTLLQARLRGQTTQNIYSIYAVSNAGSFIGLLSYPFLVEPLLSLSQQGWIWSMGYVIWVGLMTVLFVRAKTITTTEPVTSIPSPQNPWIWFLLAGAGTYLLSTTTHTLTQGIASFPFFWVIPLALYLLSFVMVFARREVIPEKTLSLFAFFGSVGTLFISLNHSLLFTTIVLSVYLFAGCLFLHNLLFQQRPSYTNLTQYYLWIAAGGGAGTILATLLAPRVFAVPIEFSLGAIALLVGSGWQLIKQQRALKWFQQVDRKWQVVLVVICALVVWLPISQAQQNVLATSRSFFGAYKVSEFQKGSMLKRELANGRIVHGTQFVDAEAAKRPTTYYGFTSGIGQVFALDTHGSKRVGVVGLGVGTLAAYCGPYDEFRFFEIDAKVHSLANDYFSFLAGCQQVDVVIGDGRLLLRAETETKQSRYHLLVIDAFSDDAIPLHLLTREAMEVYESRLEKEGVLAVHISNRYVDLVPVLRAFQRERGWEGRVVKDGGKETEGTVVSTWIVLSQSAEQLPAINEHSVMDLKNVTKTVTWTDDYSSLFSVIR